MRYPSMLLASLILASSCAVADDKLTQEVESYRQQGYSVKTISPIFSQLVMFSFPAGFSTVYEDAKPTSYIREAVLSGETVDKWSQMLTVTGFKGLAANPNVTPQRFAERIAGGFKNACPTSFAVIGLGPALKVGAYDAFAGVASCGTAKPVGEPYSESALLLIIKGETDYYTIQWAERGSASSTPLNLDPQKWVNKLKSLAPMKLCPIVPGEKPPYPSCVGSGNTEKT